MASLQDVEAAAQKAQAAAQAHAAATEQLRAEVSAAQTLGIPDTKIARAAGVSLRTVRIWTGKETRKKTGN